MEAVKIHDFGVVDNHLNMNVKLEFWQSSWVVANSWRSKLIHMSTSSWDYPQKNCPNNHGNEIWINSRLECKSDSSNSIWHSCIMAKIYWNQHQNYWFNGRFTNLIKNKAYYFNISNCFDFNFVFNNIPHIAHFRIFLYNFTN